MSEAVTPYFIQMEDGDHVLVESAKGIIHVVLADSDYKSLCGRHVGNVPVESMDMSDVKERVEDICQTCYKAARLICPGAQEIIFLTREGKRVLYTGGNTWEVML